MKNREKMKQVFFFLCAMCILATMYFFLNLAINKYKYEKMYTTENEFLRTVNCAPLFNQYPEGTMYEIKFWIKAEKPGTVFIYQQNGSESRYSFLENTYVTTEWEEKTLTVTPQLIDKSVRNSYLSFYGEYGTGVVPSVKNIRIKKQIN